MYAFYYKKQNKKNMTPGNPISNPIVFLTSFNNASCPVKVALLFFYYFLLFTSLPECSMPELPLQLKEWGLYAALSSLSPRLAIL